MSSRERRNRRKRRDHGAACGKRNRGRRVGAPGDGAMGLDHRSPAFAHTQTARRNEEPETTSSTGEIIKNTYRTPDDERYERVLRVRDRSHVARLPKNPYPRGIPIRGGVGINSKRSASREQTQTTRPSIAALLIRVACSNGLPHAKLSATIGSARERHP